MQSTAGKAKALDCCLGLPLEQALAALHTPDDPPKIVYTGERAAEGELTPRVIAVRENTLIVAYFRDGAPKEENA